MLPRRTLGEALEVDDGPIRFPKGSVGADINAVERIEGGYAPARMIRMLLVAVGRSRRSR
jgi:hypothetical protein